MSIATPQWAIAQVGSWRSTPSKVRRAMVNQYEWIIATPRSNSACTLGSQEVGKESFPSFSSCWAATGPLSMAVTRPASTILFKCTCMSVLSDLMRVERPRVSWTSRVPQPTRVAHKFYDYVMRVGRSQIARQSKTPIDGAEDKVARLIRPMHLWFHFRSHEGISDELRPPAHLRGNRRSRRRAPGGGAAQPQPAGGLAPDPCPRRRPRRTAVRPHRAAGAADLGGRGSAAAGPSRAGGGRIAQRTGRRTQEGGDRHPAYRRDAAGDREHARRLPQPFP